MKKCLLLFVLPILLCSCKKNEVSIGTEIITKGGKWNIKIGSTAAEVYGQIQALGAEKSFQFITVVKQGKFSKPEEIQTRLPYYNSLLIESQGVEPEYVNLTLGSDRVTSVFAFKKSTGTSNKWPLAVSDDLVIKPNDTFADLYRKLLAIYQLPKYTGLYTLAVSEKPLNKGYDVNMANYEEWGFVIYSQAKVPKMTGRSTVNLYFSNGRLIKIKHTYEEFETLVIDPAWK